MTPLRACKAGSFPYPYVHPGAHVQPDRHYWGAAGMRAQIFWHETAMEEEVDFEVGHSFRTLDSLEASLLRWQDSH